jgi:hypothetical protein
MYFDLKSQKHFLIKAIDLAFGAGFAVMIKTSAVFSPS